MYKNSSSTSSTNQKNTFIYVLSIIVGIVLYIFLISYLTNFDDRVFKLTNLKFEIFKLSWLGIGILFYCLYTWYVLTKNLFSPYIIFLAFLTVFNFGQCLLWAFGIHSDTEIGTQNLFANYLIPTYPEIIKAQLFTCLAIYFFHLGAMFCYKPKPKFPEKDNNSNFEITYYKKAMFLISSIMAIIAVPVSYYKTLYDLQVSLQYGYAAIYYSEFASQAGITLIIEIFFFPSLVGMLIGSNYSKKIQILVYSIVSIYTILNLLAGDRGSWIYMIITLIWMHHVFVKKFKVKEFLKFTLIALTVLYFISAIISLRQYGLSNIGFNEFKEAFNLKNFPVFTFIFEMGNSMGIVLILLSAGSIWDYSNSYLVAILGMPSTRIPALFGLDIILIPNWFSQEYLNISWGSGFSLFGEALLNGGIYYAPIIILLIGFFISTVLYTSRNMNFYNAPLRFFVIVTSLHSLIGWSRGSSLEYLRDWYRGTIVIVIIIWILSQILIQLNSKYTKR
jgi:oligosaccharide repeat unit polymerase